MFRSTPYYFRGWRLNHWLFSVENELGTEFGSNVVELICELIVKTYAKNMDLPLRDFLEASAVPAPPEKKWTEAISKA